MNERTEYYLARSAEALTELQRNLHLAEQWAKREWIPENGIAKDIGEIAAAFGSTDTSIWRLIDRISLLTPAPRHE